MRAPNQSATLAAKRSGFTPKICYFDPLAAGPRDSWASHMRRFPTDAGFDCLLSSPLFDPGTRDDIFLTANHDRIHPTIGLAKGCR